jgi:hypothetical protein
VSRDSVQDTNRYVIDGVHEGPVLPTRQRDLLRIVFLRTGADVRGSVLAGDLSAEGHDIRVSQSVYASGEVSVAVTDGRIVFESCLGAGRSILAVSDDARSYVRFGADVTATVTNLSNCVVYGNIYGDRVLLRNCAVLGSVHAATQLTVDNALVGTFSCARLSLNGGLKLVSPVAMCGEKPELSHPVSCLAFDDIAKLLQKTATPPGEYQFTPEDIKPLAYDDAAGQERKPQYYLTLAPRILNLRDKSLTMVRNRAFVQALALRNLIHPDERASLPFTLDDFDTRILARLGLALPPVDLGSRFQLDVSPTSQESPDVLAPEPATPTTAAMGPSNSEHAVVCGNCGASFPPDARGEYCDECGRRL